ncbi:unnamed protein product [Lepeophtheirus salmonis]|uniref:(salmon louse) hypothetical protein n=1 Tax=Lepeophtheirus salmonis TaxID=72036 RepID=A0A7R8HBE7_LEPSM|nr:unnamed protein product [Lepeophtheirus salmonis]CAF2985883.1 unnamed protein product [Lepeophtheirus salmonis]
MPHGKKIGYQLENLIKESLGRELIDNSCWDVTNFSVVPFGLLYNCDLAFQIKSRVSVLMETIDLLDSVELNTVVFTDNHHCSMSVSTTLGSFLHVKEVSNSLVQLLKSEAIIFNSSFFFVSKVLILESESDEGDDVVGGVVTCIAALERLLQDMDETSHILTKIKSSALLNTQKFSDPLYPVDEPLDNSRRNLQIQEEVVELENTKARNNIPYRGNGPYEN